MRTPQTGVFEVLRMATLLGLALLPQWRSREGQILAASESDRDIEADAAQNPVRHSIRGAAAAYAFELEYGSVEMNTVGRQRDAKELTTRFPKSSPQFIKSADSLFHDIDMHVKEYVQRNACPVRSVRDSAACDGSLQTPM
jgi:hypothetical protein